MVELTTLEASPLIDAHAAIAAPARPRASRRGDSRVAPDPVATMAPNPESVTPERYSHLDRYCCEDRLSPGNTPPRTTPSSSTTPRCWRPSAPSEIAMTNALSESFVDSYKTELIATRVAHSRAACPLMNLEA